MQKIRVAVVDDQRLIREGLVLLLASVPDLEVAGQAADGRGALKLVREAAPDVILMDVRMPGMSGIAATRELLRRYPRVRVIVLTSFDNDEYVFEALRAGASGYLLKNAAPDYLAAAIRAVHAGDSMLDPAVTSRVIRRANRSEEEAPPPERLTRRERQVLHLMAVGMTNAEIAARLTLAEGTVKNHVSHIIDKLNARDRTHAVRLAAEWGLLHE